MASWLRSKVFARPLPFFIYPPRRFHLFVPCSCFPSEKLYLDVDTVTTSSLLRRVYHKGGNTNDFSRVLGVAIKGRIFLSYHACVPIEKSGQANGFQLKEQEYKAHRSRDENDYQQRILRVLEQW